jgi:DNA-binding transcriptional LysR family regulator
MDDRAVFLAVAEAGSFAGAAGALGTSRSTVLRRVAALEERLGLILVQRAGRHIALTEAGRRYADEVRPLLRELDRVEEELRLRDEALTGTLRLWLPVLGTTAGVASALAEFRDANPGVHLEIELADSAAFKVGDFDVALQVGLRRNPSFRARTLYRERLILVASPAYLARFGDPTVDTLPSHRAVRMRDARGRVVPWRFPDGDRLPSPPPVVTVNAVGFAHELAVLGQGIARVPRALAAPQLQAGTLVQVLDHVWVEEPVSFVFPGRPGPVARAFIDQAGAWFSERFTAR